MIFLYLFIEFFKIGLFTFGGGYAMIPLVRQVVLEYGWMTEDAFSNFIGVCESTPGPIAINMATYVGSTTGGFFGSVVATLGGQTAINLAEKLNARGVKILGTSLESINVAEDRELFEKLLKDLQQWLTLKERFQK